MPHLKLQLNHPPPPTAPTSPPPPYKPSTTTTPKSPKPQRSQRHTHALAWLQEEATESGSLLAVQRWDRERPLRSAEAQALRRKQAEEAERCWNRVQVMFCVLLGIVFLGGIGWMAWIDLVKGGEGCGQGQGHRGGKHGSPFKGRQSMGW